MAHQGVTKIGYSTCPEMRIYDFTTRYPGIVLTHEIATNTMRYVERLLYWELKDYHVQDEDHEGEDWFKLPDTEIARFLIIKRYDLKPELIGWLTAKETRPILPWRQERARHASSYNWGRGVGR
jgi:hypothetical protein